MNNRELATFILLGGGALLGLGIRDVRRLLPSVGKQLMFSTLTPFFAAFVAVEITAIWLAARLSLWSTNLLGGTILWFLTVGFVWFLNLGDADKDPDFFKRRVLETLGVTAFLEFFMNAEAMPLAFELAAQIFLVLVVGVNVVASREEEYKPAARLTSGVLIIATLGPLTYSLIRVVTDWDTVDKPGLVNELLLPIWLSAVALPVLYPIALYMGYQLLFVRLSFLNQGSRPRLRARLGIAWELRGALVDVGQVRGQPARDAAQARNTRSAREAVRRFKDGRATDAAERAANRLRLTRNAGRTGKDEGGRLLDRREFAKTKDALEWLSTCHMGWYRNEDRPDEYRADLLDVLSGSQQFDFESDEPVHQMVRKDGQAWYAYRRTPSGHVFGIGADGRPPSQWFYDAPSPPSGFPSQGSANWTDSMSEVRPEWGTEPKT